MAKFDVIYTPDRSTVSTVNLKKSVGNGGVNLREDVLLIQALFNYIADGLSPNSLGLGGDYKVPEMTGIIDAETHSAIGEFQIRWIGSLIINRFDGRIDPASYRGRKFNLHARRYMSITLLHHLATDASVMKGDGDYTSQLPRMNAELASYLDRSLIES